MAVNKPQETEEQIRAGMPKLDEFEVYHNKILVGIYMRPEKTSGGLYLPDTTRDESRIVPLTKTAGRASVPWCSRRARSLSKATTPSSSTTT